MWLLAVGPGEVVPSIEFIGGIVIGLGVGWSARGLADLLAFDVVFLIGSRGYGKRRDDRSKRIERHPPGPPSGPGNNGSEPH